MIRLAFWALGAVIVVLAYRMVATQRIVRSLLLHVVTLFLLGMLYLAAGAWLMAAVQIMVYAGSVSVLLVFALMLTPVGGAGEQALDHPAHGRAVPVALVLFGVTAYALIGAVGGAAMLPVSVEVVARSLFTTFAYPFELLSVVLLVALVGVAVVAGRMSSTEAS